VLCYYDFMSVKCREGVANNHFQSVAEEILSTEIWFHFQSIIDPLPPGIGIYAYFLYLVPLLFTPFIDWC